MAIKIDLQKAFDRLKWDFILHVLCFFRFSTAWIDIIMSCITTSSLSILVSGNRLPYFCPFRGIRQGVPLFSYIFILCMEYLAHLIQHEVDLQHWKGVKTSRDGPTFTHLFFADDLILFDKASKRNCTAIKNTLDNFCSISGQKINFSKSKIYFSLHTLSSRISQVESELGFNSCKDFGKYLGMPIITDQCGNRAYNFLIEKLCSKLAN